jgi:cobalt/nickel transport system permease protein
MPEPDQSAPGWLLARQDYEPLPDRDRFIAKSMLAIVGMLAQFRLDDGTTSRISASAPTKLLFGLGCLLLTSLSHNFLFALVVLACVLVRLCLMPSKKLRRIAAVACGAAGLTFLVMLPAALLGQQQSSLLMAAKVFISVSIAMMVALTTPFNQLTAALRTFHVPNLVILTIDLALKSIVRLGGVALEALTALRMRSVGRNVNKREALGGVGGVVFLKTNEAAQATYDAMACRGFEGEYPVPHTRQWRAVDLAWLAAFIALLALFIYLQTVI